MEKSSEAVAHILVSEGRKATQFTQSKKVTFFQKTEFSNELKIQNIIIRHFMKLTNEAAHRSTRSMNFQVVKYR